MERRKKQIERDNQDLDTILRLIGDADFRAAVVGLTEGWAGRDTTISDVFADLSERHGASSDVMESAIELLQAQAENVE